MQFFLSTCMYKCQSTGGWAGVVLGRTMKGCLLYLTVLFLPSFPCHHHISYFFLSFSLWTLRAVLQPAQPSYSSRNARLLLCSVECV